MDYVVVRHRFTEGLCATGVRLRSPVLFLFLGAIRIEATGGSKAAASGTHIFSGDAEVRLLLEFEGKLKSRTPNSCRRLSSRNLFGG